MPKHTLVTGSSGTGKTTIATLLKQQYACIDADRDDSIAIWRHKTTGETFPGSDGKNDGHHDWLWDINRLRYVLDNFDKPLIVCGTANNSVDAYSLFDQIIVLAPSKHVIQERLAIREGNDFGKDEASLAWAMQNYDDIVKDAKNKDYTIIDSSNHIPTQTVQHILKLIG